MAHTLLLADDSVTIQRVVELTFAGEDIRVVSVGNGQQAIDRLSTDPPDIVLADIAMPLLDGYAVANYVRNHDALRDVPVLLMVGAFDPVDEDRVQASGASGVLVKPFEPTLVISRVKQLLGMSGHLAPASETTDEAEERVVRRAGLVEPAAASTVAAPAPASVASRSPAGQPEPVAAAVVERAAASSSAGRAATADQDLANDWMGEPEGGRAVDLASQLFGAPPAEREIARAATDALWDRYTSPPPPSSPPPRPVPATYASPPAGGGVADAFTAMLAVEQGEAPPAAPQPLTLDPDTMNALVEQITAKVIDRLGTRAVQERATQVLTEVAERLVREEIARIREAAGARKS